MSPLFIDKETNTVTYGDWQDYRNDHAKEYSEWLYDVSCTAAPLPVHKVDAYDECYVWVNCEDRVPTKEDVKDSHGYIFCRNVQTKCGGMNLLSDLLTMEGLNNIEWLSLQPVSKDTNAIVSVSVPSIDNLEAVNANERLKNISQIGEQC